MDNKVLTLENISKTFDLRLLYKNVGLCICQGQTILITGKNGSGKSTLLKMVAELGKPSTGTIINTTPKEKIGYLGHQTFIYPHLSAYENLAFWAKAFRNDKVNEKEILAVLKKVFLEKFAYDKAGIFSRGMAQRLNIARIILQKPNLLLLDEPATGLDRESRELFYQVIEEFQQNNCTILWVSHNPNEDSRYASHILHIEKQKITLTELSDKTKEKSVQQNNLENQGENAC